jgi:hypothetical protein
MRNIPFAPTGYGNAPGLFYRSMIEKDTKIPVAPVAEVDL